MIKSSKLVRTFLAGTALALAAGSAAPASASQIILTNIGGVDQGTQAYYGFQIAANYWSRVLTNDVTVRLNVGFQTLGPNILGSTSSPRVSKLTQDVYSRLGTNSSSTLDAAAVANLSPLVDTQFTGIKGINMYTPGYTDEAAKTGIDNSKRVFDNDGTFNNAVMGMTRANAKALGYTGGANNGNPNANNPFGTTADATIRFSSDFAFDFNSTDGVQSGKIDFVGVAIHEIGHALGFVSGVDDYDVLGLPNGEAANEDCGGVLCKNYPVNDDWWGDTLDLFRRSALSNGELDWTVGTASYFSVDGENPFMAGLFSTGSDNGDGRQASHWKDNIYTQGSPGCLNPGPALGIMDPTFGRCELGGISALDLAAFDAIGWNLNVDVLTDPAYRFTTADAFKLYVATVPEPATWAMMIAGFGFVGAVARRSKKVKISFA